MDFPDLNIPEQERADDSRDDELTCKDCGSPFTFTARDKDFYKVHGYEAPKRCRPCRIAKKKKFNERDQRDNYR